MAYPEDTPAKDPEGFLRAELAELKASTKEATHRSPGHRSARLDHCERLLAFAREAHVDSKLVEALEHHRAAVVVPSAS